MFWLSSLLLLLLLSASLFLAATNVSGSPIKNETQIRDESKLQLARVEIGSVRLTNGGEMSASETGPLELLAAGITDTRIRLMQNQMDLMQHRLHQQETMTSSAAAPKSNNGGNVDVIDIVRRLEVNITKLLKQQLRRQQYFNAHQIITGNATIELPVDPESESYDPDKDDEVVLVQQHFGGTSFFDKPWVEYRDGFGHVTGNYWLGNDRIHELTKDGKFKLRVDLLARANNRWYWAEYSVFRVLDVSMGYVLNVDGYRGTTGDALKDANGSKFSAKDTDNDIWGDNCAAHAHLGSGAGFWYRNCGSVFINSPLNGHVGFRWQTLPTGTDKTLMYSRMTLVRSK